MHPAPDRPHPPAESASSAAIASLRAISAIVERGLCYRRAGDARPVLRGTDLIEPLPHGPRQRRQSRIWVEASAEATSATVLRSWEAPARLRPVPLPRPWRAELGALLTADRAERVCRARGIGVPVQRTPRGIGRALVGRLPQLAWIDLQTQQHRQGCIPACKALLRRRSPARSRLRCYAHCSAASRWGCCAPASAPPAACRSLAEGRAVV